MIKVFIPTDKNIKSNIRGLWLDNGKLFYDYLTIKEGEFTLGQIKAIAKDYNQLAVFFTNEAEVFIYDSRKNSFDLLEHKETLFIDKADLKIIARAILRKYNGLTIYNQGHNYLIEYWHN